MNKLILPALLAAVLAGCTSAPPADSGAGAPVESRTPDTGVAKVTTPDLDSSALPKELTDPKSVLSKRSVYFDFDKYDVKDEYKELVTAHAKFLSNNRGFKMLIQGNTDERGSREYNLALGQKRSDAVKKMLLLVGAKEDQIETVSLGEEKPKAEGHDESAWSQNRRADMLYRNAAGKGEF